MNLGNIINELYPNNKLTGELWYQCNEFSSIDKYDDFCLLSYEFTRLEEENIRVVTGVFADSYQ